MIKDKRDSLEHFIQEQLIGPGGCGNNFGVYPSQEVAKEESVCEVLNTTQDLSIVQLFFSLKKAANHAPPMR